MMKICPDCGVELNDETEFCPLCGKGPECVESDDGCAGYADLGCEEIDPSDDSAGGSRRRRSRPRPTRSARLWLWEMVSILAFTAGIVVFASDFAYGFDVTWAGYPLTAIISVWAAGTALIFLSRRPLLLMVAVAAAISLLLYVLSRFSQESGWFLQLALPITILVFVTSGVAIAVIRRHKLTLITTLATLCLAVGVFLVGLEMLLNNAHGAESLVSWSLVALACTVSLFLLLLLINRSVRRHHSEYRRIFHL